MRFRGLTYAYPGAGGFRLGPLDVEGPSDRPWLVLGPSGSGKSTLLRLLGGSLRPGGGTVDGVAPGRAAYLPQFPERALAGRNLAEDLCGRLRPDQAERRRLRAALRAAGLEGLPLSRRSRSLSAGERRRLALALMVLSNYEAWALDEPEAALDAEARRSLLALLGDRRGRGPLWIGTHRFAAYGGLRPWAIALSDGEMVAYGELEAVLANPRAARALSLSQRPAFALLEGLGPGLGGASGTSLETPLETPSETPSETPKRGVREDLLRLQLQERMGFD